MPVSVQCDELQPGMTLYEPVIHRDRVMLPGGKVLTKADIGVLRRRFPDLCVRVGNPVLDDKVEFDDDRRNREVAETVRNTITEAMSDVGKRFSRHASVAKVDFRAIHAAIDEIMKYLASNPVSAALIARAMSGNDYLAERTGNVFYLGMLLGCAARGYISEERQRQSKARGLQSNVTMDLTPLGLGLLFMDLGLMSHKKLFKAGHALTKEDLRTIRDHPEASAEMLPESFSAAARAVVRSHHENCDGTGYPNGLPADKIHVLARVARIVDAYEAATAGDVFENARSPVRALWEMTSGPYRRFYDPKLMKVFARLIQPFPITAKVEMDDGRRAVVARYNRANPFQPMASIAYDADNRLLPRSELTDPIPLDPAKGLRIKSYLGEDVSYLYDDAQAHRQAAAPEQPQDLLDAFYP